MEGIQIKVENNYNISIIKVGGYIDTTTSSELEHHLNELIKNGSYNIIIDLSNVDYVSSAGWGIFISEIKGIREHGGDLKLVGMIPEVYEVFELLEFHNILKAFDTIKEAVADFQRAGVAPITAAERTAQTAAPASSTSHTHTASASSHKAVQHEMTLEEKIKKIIKEMPYAGTIAIAKQLNTPAYGYTKIGWFTLKKILKQLKLDTKEKRMEFARRA